MILLPIFLYINKKSTNFIKNANVNYKKRRKGKHER